MLKILGCSSYEDKGKNYGDCIILTNQKEAVIYDCGSEEHAKRAIAVLKSNAIDKATVILSHNDSDHFAGIPYLIEQGCVRKVCTILLLKYKKEILQRLNDGRRNLNSIENAIKDLYSNIDSLSDTVPLYDVYADKAELPSWISCVGPTKDYMLNAAVTALSSSEGDHIDGETVINAASIQFKATVDNNTLLLTGDCTPAAIPESVDLHSFTHIQLPHHGKGCHAEEIFERAYPDERIIYLVSDNTGNSNGGSDDLKSTGHHVKNTKTAGDIVIESYSQNYSYTRRPLG